MNKELQTIKRNLESHAVISSIRIDGSRKENYMSYSDTDAQVDYFNGVSFGTNLTIEYLQKDGGDVIRVYTSGGEEEGSEEAIKTFKKIEKIAKKAGYIAEIKGEQKSMKNGDYINSWYEISGILVRKVGV